MAGFGEDLKRERENRGITLESLAAETRVKLHHLECVEQEHFVALPGGLFRRSIVRAYLTALGLEEAAWLLRFDSAFDAYERNRTGASAASAQAAAGKDSWAAFAENVKRNRAGGAGPGRARWLGVLALFLAVAAAGWAIWRLVLYARLER